MQKSDKAAFFQYVGDVLAFYKDPASQFALNAWWTILERFDFDAVQTAMNGHMGDPDKGCYAPKPADIVRQLEGTRNDAAALAWSQVDRALRHNGVYPSVVFPDPLIHAVIEDLGGWASFGSVTNDEWVFLGHRFQKAYQAYRASHAKPTFPPYLTGLAELQNTQAGQAVQAPLMLGDKTKCTEVYMLGCGTPRNTPKPLPLEEVRATLLQLANTPTARKAG